MYYPHPGELSQMEISRLLKSSTGESLPEAWLLQLRQDRRKGVRTLYERYIHQIDSVHKQKRSYHRRFRFEQVLFHQGFQHVAGVDEAGRGCLAGPVVAAAVVLPHDCHIYGIDDSKRLTKSKRVMLAREIVQVTRNWSLVVVGPGIIDAINIHRAGLLAMRLAVEKLRKVDFVLADGFRIDHLNVPQRRLIHGDRRSISIAAASILAKVYRDRIMDEYDALYPGYAFKENKGYSTQEHRLGILRYGPSPIHRFSFHWGIEVREAASDE